MEANHPQDVGPEKETETEWLHGLAHKDRIRVDGIIAQRENAIIVKEELRHEHQAAQATIREVQRELRDTIRDFQATIRELERSNRALTTRNNALERTVRRLERQRPQPETNARNTTIVSSSYSSRRSMMVF